MGERSSDGIVPFTVNVNAENLEGTFAPGFKIAQGRIERCHLVMVKILCGADSNAGLVRHNDENAPTGSFRKGRWVGMVMMNCDSERTGNRFFILTVLRSTAATGRTFPAACHGECSIAD